MCGLAGFWHISLGDSYDHETVIRHMTDTLVHRGPDDAGVWVDEQVCIALGHRRLSIVDLSDAGHQPMKSASGRYVMVFNGDIYNHLRLRQQLVEEDCHSSSRTMELYGGWRGHSDTETLLAGFEAWGIEETLKRTVGMFAIALWDSKENVLTLARDRMGEKPLYFGFQKNTFMFGSELKALKAHPDFVGEIDREVLCLYLRHSYIPAPYSIYKGIKKLLPGSFLQMQLGTDSDSCRSLSSKTYWSFVDAAAHGLEMPFVGSDIEAVASLDSQLRESVGLQMMAEVPLGAFLSGGVDSATVVALMQAQSGRPVNTFTIGFEGNRLNEAEYAKAVAKHLGTDHTELYVSSTKARQVIPMLGKMYDEPFADSSQIPTFLVAQMAQSNVKVALTGDGGDELFCGYNSYAQADKWKRIARIPTGIRKAVGSLAKKIDTHSLDALFSRVDKFITLPVHMSERFSNFAARLESVDSVNDLYYSLGSVISDPENVVIGAKEPATFIAARGHKTAWNEAKSQMMLLDATTYLPDDILVKVDRAGMKNSLETRIPLLDHRLVELACSLPIHMKVRNGQSKWILRQVLYQYVPFDLIDRPKAGFSIPLKEWLRGPLCEWATILLDKHRLHQEGYFNAEYICHKWRQHLTGERNNESFLWSILMFQVWLQEQ